MPVGIDPGNKHFVVSLCKSMVRLLGCAVAIAFNSVGILATAFLIAELLGIYEELE
jgi:hypothetical protein